MKWFFICCFLSLIGLGAEAQSFVFGDTYPTNNPDSLERWLKASRVEDAVRFATLTKLERSYYWNNAFQLGKHVAEMKTMQAHLKSELGQACLWYIEGLSCAAQNKTVEAASFANKALTLFQKLNDKSGILHAYGILILVNSTIYGNQLISDPKLSTSYVRTIEKLQKETGSAHDRLMQLLVYTRYLYGQGGDIQELRRTAEAGLKVIEKQPECRYASFRFERLRALGFQVEGRGNESYQVNKKLLEKLSINQPWELGTTYYNTAVDCYALKYNKEGIGYCQKAIALLSADKRFQHVLAGPYTKYRELVAAEQNYVLANQLADSVMKYNSVVFILENDKKLIELQSKYEFERKQQTIQELDKANHLKLALLLIALGAVLILGYLGYKLNQTIKRLKVLTKVRDQFFTIVAHDLRRPLYAFHDIGKLMEYYLQKNDVGAIQTLAHGINESSVRVEKMLDNLLNWGLSQQDSIPYQPKNIIIAERVKEIVELYQSVNLLKKIEISVDIPESLTSYVDTNAFDLVIRNLIDNSFKILPNKGKIAIAAKVVDDQRIEVEVEDDGNGLSSEKLKIIEDILASPEKAQVGELGMGVGLITAARFIKKSNGFIKVLSSKENGTRFLVNLPSSK